MIKESLAETHPLLVSEWNLELNYGISPNDVTQGSNKRIWWTCQNCKENYYATINHRTNNRGCPFCSGKKACNWNCLETKRPDIAKQWHPTLNGDLTPKDFTIGSGKNIWWHCDKCEQDYKATIYNKVGNKSNCPYCSILPKKVFYGNCLATKRPDIAKQWHPTLNGILTPQNVTFKSKKSAWWLCPNCNENYESKICNRTNDYNCPYCAGQKVCDWNCLATQHPEISKLWHQTKNGNITPHDVMPHTHKKAWWHCDKCEQDYKSPIDRKTGTGRCGCPYCSNPPKLVYDGNCLETLYPEISRYWNVKKNGNLTPRSVFANSHMKVWWTCLRCGGDVLRSLAYITQTNKEFIICNKCNIYYHEELCRQIMFEIFAIEFVKSKPASLLNDNGKLLELDCYNCNVGINVEYDGIQHYEYPNKLHKNKERFLRQQKNDSCKDQWCIDNGILNIRVPYTYDTKEEIKNFIINQLMMVNKYPLSA